MIPELHRAVSNIVRPARTSDLAPVAKSTLELKIATIIYRGVPLASFANVVNVVIALLVGWSMIDHWVIGGWAGAVILVSALRFGFWWQARGKRPTLTLMRRFYTANMILMMITGALWGMLTPIFAVYGQVGHVFLPFILAGMTAASIVSSGACWRCVVAFNIPALLPLSGAFLFWGGEGSGIISFVIAFYAVMTSILAIQTSRMITRAILLSTRNSQLTEELEAKFEADVNDAKRFRAIIESSRELTLIFSPEGRIIYASPSIEDSLGYDPETVAGMTTRQLIHEDDLPQLRATGEQALSELGAVIPLAHVCMRDVNSDYRPFAGRLTNMLYVPGVEGFVFTGSTLPAELAARLHAAE